jgi:hypothetical protein
VLTDWATFSREAAISRTTSENVTSSFFVDRRAGGLDLEGKGIVPCSIIAKNTSA